MKSSKANQITKDLIANVFKLRGEVIKTFDCFRKGKVGSFQEELPEGYAEKIDKWSDKFLQEAGVTMDDILNFQNVSK